MLRSGLDENTMRLGHNCFAKSDHLVESAGLGENSVVGCNANDPAQDLGRNAVARVTVDNSVQPTSTKIVVTGIGSKRVNENIDIRKDHRSSIRPSRSLDRFRSMPGSVPPEALEIGNRTRARLAGFDSTSTVFKPSSTNEVRVRPCSAAFFLALRNKSSESRIVVLICQRIFLKHQYVNLACGGGRSMIPSRTYFMLSSGLLESRNRPGGHIESKKFLVIALLVLAPCEI